MVNNAVFKSWVIYFKAPKKTRITAKNPAKLVAGNDSKSAHEKLCQNASTNLKSEKIKDKNSINPDSAMPVRTAPNAGISIAPEPSITRNAAANLFFISKNRSSLRMRFIIFPYSSFGGSGNIEFFPRFSAKVYGLILLIRSSGPFWCKEIKKPAKMAGSRSYSPMRAPARLWRELENELH